MTSADAPLHDMMKPLYWLLGKWRSENGRGKYPTMSEFSYIEEVEFFHVGQPNIQFSMYSWTPDNKKPLHREIGFIRIKPESSHIALVSAQNIGVNSVEEGELKGQEIRTETHTVGRLTFGIEPHVCKTSRVLRLDGDNLEQIFYMETDRTELTEHLRAVYKRV